MKHLSYFLLFIVFGHSQFNSEKDLYERFNFFFGKPSISDEILIESTYILKSETESSYYYSVSPNVNLKLSESVSIHFKSHIFKNSDFYIPKSESDRFYSFKEFSGHNFYAEQGFLKYQSKLLDFKIGRFTDVEGYAPFENLALGNHTYHDGYKFSFKYKKLKLFSRYFKLSPYRFANTINRHFYQHGLRVGISKSFSFSVYETAIEAFENTGTNFSYLNPLSIYYANQMNDFREANINIGFSTSYKTENLSIWTEFLVDDFQIESKNESSLNKEPTEFGLILGAVYHTNLGSFYLNHAVVKNRTYNDPYDQNTHGVSYTKYIDRNSVIGYKYGNNLTKTDFYYAFNLIDNLNSIVMIEVIQKGDEAVFSLFDRSYLDSSGEAFPFGEINKEYNISTKFDYVKDMLRINLAFTSVHIEDNVDLIINLSMNYNLGIN